MCRNSSSEKFLLKLLVLLLVLLMSTVGVLKSTDFPFWLVK